MTQAPAPIIPKDWLTVLPVSIIAVGFLVYIGVWAADKLGLTKKNGSISHKTFADDEDRYWSHMREVVTEPLAEVLKVTNDVLKDLRDRAIREEGRELGRGEKESG